MIKTKQRVVLLLLISGCFACSGGGDSDPGPQQFDVQELTQFASAILVTSPALNSLVTEATSTVTVEVPAAASATKVDLYIDNILVASDSDGAPWQFDWPSYFWGDNNFHAISLRAELATGQNISSTQQHQVLVSDDMSSSLQFADGIDNSTIKDANTLDVSFNPIEQASIYQLEITSANPGEVLDIDSETTTLTDLDVGSYLIRFRGGLTSASGSARFGPWSSPANFAVLTPDLPSNINTMINSSGALFDAVLNWDVVSPNDIYTVTLTRQGAAATEEFIVNGEGEFVISELPIGNHTWQLSRQNEFGHESLNSELLPIEAGVFAKSFGGTGNEIPQQVVETDDGGAIILTLSTSDEITGQLSNLVSSWIFKVDSAGDMQWQYTPPADNALIYRRLIPLDDGSVIAVGRDVPGSTAHAVRLDAEGQVVFERMYSGDGPGTDVFNFNTSAIDGDNLIVATVERNAAYCFSGCQNRPLVKIHKLDAMSGDLLESSILPSPVAGYHIVYVDEIGVAANGNTYVGGTIIESTMNTFFDAEVFVVELDEQLTQVAVWRKAGLEIDVQGISLLSNGDLAVSTRDNLEVYQIDRVAADLGSSVAASAKYMSFSAQIGRLQEMSDGRLFSLLPTSASSSFEQTVRLHQLDASLNTVDTYSLPTAAATELERSNMILYEDNTALLVYEKRDPITSVTQLALEKVVFIADD